MFPIDTSTVEEDCVPFPSQTDFIATTKASRDWIFRHPTLWPVPVDCMKVNITVEKVLQPARELSEKYGLDFTKVVPPYVMEGLRRICDEVEAPPSVQPIIFYNLSSSLETRLHWLRLLELHPEIRAEPIQSPVFIVGLNQTGTTFLHRMMDSITSFSTPYLEDQMNFCAGD